MAKKKLNLTIADPSANYKTFGAFAKDYRLSTNVIDRRNEKSYADTLDRYGRNYDRFMGETPTPSSRKARQETMTPMDRSNSDVTTPDDYSGGAADGGMMAKTTPSNSFSQTRKVDAEEAVRKTHFERN